MHFVTLAYKILATFPSRLCAFLYLNSTVAGYIVSSFPMVYFFLFRTYKLQFTYGTGTPIWCKFKYFPFFVSFFSLTCSPSDTFPAIYLGFFHTSKRGKGSSFLTKRKNLFIFTYFTSVADPWCLSRILIFSFRIPDLGSKRSRSGSAPKNF